MCAGLCPTLKKTKYLSHISVVRKIDGIRQNQLFSLLLLSLSLDQSREKVGNYAYKYEIFLHPRKKINKLKMKKKKSLIDMEM